MLLAVHFACMVRFCQQGAADWSQRKIDCETAIIIIFKHIYRYFLNDPCEYLKASDFTLSNLRWFLKTPTRVDEKKGIGAPQNLSGFCANFDD